MPSTTSFPPLRSASAEGSLNDARHGVSMRASYPFAPLMAADAAAAGGDGGRDPIKFFPKAADRITAAWIEKERGAAARSIEVRERELGRRDSQQHVYIRRS
jgi:hypothetical protein